MLRLIQAKLEERSVSISGGRPFPKVQFCRELLFFCRSSVLLSGTTEALGSMWTTSIPITRGHMMTLKLDVLLRLWLYLSIHSSVVLTIRRPAKECTCHCKFDIWYFDNLHSANLRSDVRSSIIWTLMILPPSADLYEVYLCFLLISEFLGFQTDSSRSTELRTRFLHTYIYSSAI